MLAICLSAALLWAQAAVPLDTSDLYYLVLLRRSPTRKPLSPSETERIQSAHMANIRQMAKDGILFAAGPFEDDPPTLSGIFVFKTASLEQAQRIAGNDPTVIEGRNTVSVFAWRGPKGIGDKYFRIHKEVPDTPEDMGIHPLVLMYRGSNWDQLGDRRQSVLADHRDYVTRLRHDGKLGAAGPFVAPEDLVGIEIFKRIPIEEARQLVDHDPAVQAGILRVEYHRWWCAAHVLPW